MPPVTRSMKRTAKLQSKSDLTELSETLAGDSERTLAFSHTSFSFIDSEFNGFAGQFLGRKSDLTLDNANNLLTHIPDEEIYPEPPPLMKSAPTCIDAYYIKQPSLTSYKEMKDSWRIPKITLAEVAALEMFTKVPHPNIAKYHGCITKRGRLVGIVLDKYKSTLEDRVLWDPRPFNKKLCLDQLKAAIDHVHSLGFAHNDINPNNIMLDENDTAFLIDFGSCRRIDEPLISAGTLGWMEAGSKYDLSKESHDHFAFSKLQKWIEAPTENEMLDHPEWLPENLRHL